MDVLERLSLTAAQPIGLRELARQLSVPRTTVHRVLATLEAKGVIQRVDDRGWAMGEGGIRLSGRLRMLRLAELSRPILDDIHRQVRETVNLAVPSGHTMVIVAAVQSSEPLRLVSWVGRHDEMHASALGKAYLASLPAEERDELLRTMKFKRSTSRTLVDGNQLRKDLELSRRRGFSLDDGESMDGVRCVGAAIVDRTGEPVGALSVSAPDSRLTKERVKDVGRIVARGAASAGSLIEPLPDSWA